MTWPVFRLSACASITTRSVLSLMLSVRMISCRDGFWAGHTVATAVMSSVSRHSALNLDLNIFQSSPRSAAGQSESECATLERQEPRIYTDATDCNGYPC